MKQIRRTCLLLLSLFQLSALRAEVQLPSFFSDNMVLQQSDSVAIWGKDEPNRVVVINSTWGEKVKTRSDESGDWRLKIATPAADLRQHQITVKGSSTVKIDSVMLGEVWFCSGQSNMSLPMKGAFNQPIWGSNKDVLNSENVNIRLFDAELSGCATPAYDVDGGSWRSATPATVYEFSAVAYYFARKLNSVLKVPVGVINSSWGGTAIEPWMDRNTLDKFPTYSYTALLDDEKLPVHYRPTYLYNAMIAPYVGYSIKGMLWYQGESNRPHPEEYKALFTAMIDMWRAKWGGEDLPFYYAQIAPLTNHNKNTDYKNSAFLREAQLQSQDESNGIGMVSTIDLGEPYNIHPGRKRAVGERLANWTFAKQYGYSTIGYSGPVYREMEVAENGRVTLRFDYANSLSTYGRDLTGFEIAGEDRVFRPAKAYIHWRDPEVIVYNDDVPNPVAVRYNFKSWADGSLYNEYELPASSFRTDDWDDVIGE